MPPYRTRGLAAIVGITVLLAPAYSQTKAPPTSTGTPTTGGSLPTASPGTVTAPTTGTSNSGNLSGSQGKIRISGRVMLDDGTPAPPTTIIERLCSGSAHAEGYADSKGYFYVILGQASEVMGDATQDSISPRGSGLGGSSGASLTAAGGRLQGGDNRYSGCQLRARLGGYTSEAITLVDRSPLDDPNIGIIHLHRTGEAEKATAVTATSLKAPKEARKALEKGQELARKNKAEEAIASLQQAVRVDPEFALAWCELGRLQLQAGQREDARLSLEEAVKAEPRWPEPYLRLAFVSAEARQWKDTADYSDRVLRLNSFAYPEAFFLNAAANYNLQHLDAAEKSALSAERLDTQHQFPQIAHLLGIILCDKRQYADAAGRLRTYLALAPDASDAPAARRKLEEVEKRAAESTQMAGKEPR